MCGRIKAYQFGRPLAFFAYHRKKVTTINDSYVCGVSITHGAPRSHIWTFACGETCDDISTPLFIGNRPVVGCWQPVRLGVWGCPMVGVKGTNLFVGYGQRPEKFRPEKFRPEKFRNLRC